MDKRLKPMATAARRRTRYNVKRRHLQHDVRLFGLALLMAILACSGVYTLASAPPLPPEAEQTQMVATVFAEQTSTPVVFPTIQEDQSLPGKGTLPVPLIQPELTPQGTESPTLDPTSHPPYLYYVQAGDSLKTLATRFAVKPEEITSPDPIPQTGLINPGQLLIIPRQLSNTSSSTQIMPDSEVVFSPTAADFDVEAFIKQKGGYLNQYSQYLGTTGTTTGAQVIERVATEFSVNPRLLLSLLEYQSHWVTGQPATLAQTDYPMGLVNINDKGLYQQMSWIVSLLSQGYYGWRDGSVTSVTFPDKTTLRLAPDLNAGSVALQYLFANLYNLQRWAGALNPTNGFPALYASMFGNPWLRAQATEPLFPATLTQPELVLPFEPGLVWSFTGGPHAAFGAAGALAALDFAPGGTQSGCYKSDAWVDASATGVVVRAEHNQVVIDLDGDGYEQTGWTLLYMHIAADGMIPKGTRVSVGDHLGHPSCEGGTATGVNVHIARKYNGEWILADSAIPFVLSGWQAHAGPNPYEGTLTKDGKVLTACPCSSPDTWISLSRP
jgi:murein DD-endopeptidase MepM/ murein hydrolase activator NlpD